MPNYLKRLIALLVAPSLAFVGIASANPTGISHLIDGLRWVNSQHPLLDAELTLAEFEAARQGGENPFESEPDSPGADWLINQRAGADGTISTAVYKRALRQARASERRTMVQAPELAEAQWQLMGPTNIGGRVADVAVDPLANDTVYAATAGGGVWKSTDAGTTWNFSWPDDITQTLGALAVGSDGTLYAGTGEANPGGGSITYGGTGLYRSRDGGASWQFIGLGSSGAFGRIMVDPTDPNRVLAAVAGNLYKSGGERGLYLSEDGGDTWNRILSGENDFTGAIDLAIDPVNPDNILVAMWDHHRIPSHRIYGGEGSGVWRSTDGGATWTEITLDHGLTPQQVGRIGVGFAPSDPNRAYAVVASKLDGSGVAFFRSDDGGATFTKTPASVSSLSQSSYGWWFGRLWVDPDDVNRVWVMGLNLVRSANGGDTFGSVGGVHSDQHAMAWDPKVPNRVYLGNDGGMYRSDNDGNNWTPATAQGWTQSYSVDVGELTPDHIVTGLQDNGCIRNWTGPNVGANQWTSYGCGDGLETLINPTHEATMYACGQYAACSVVAPNAPLGAPMQRVKPPGAPAERLGWWTPIIFDPTNSNTMYWGTNMVFRSLNGGSVFTPISPDLTRNQPQLDPNSGYRIRNVITAIAASASDPNVFWAGSDDGLLWKTTDLVSPNPTWTQPLGAPRTNAWITRITVDPTNAKVVYVAYSGYRSGDNAGHLWKTFDGGASWINVSGDLPEAPINDVLIVGDKRIVANDVGVFVSDDDKHYFKLGSNLPTIPVIELRYHAGTNTITAATFGHGIQRITLP